ncbi:MAG TPA: glycosyltransferase [Acidimicrobiales bacterium]|nr:glycosyltransferase [Acidimicrobiales bacterium]
MPGRVVTLTAGMGAGHDQVAVELHRRLAERDIQCDVLDVWELLPLGLGRLITLFYKGVIRRVPWVYEVVYSIWLRPTDNSAKRASPIIRLAGRRLERWMEEHRPDVVVSTFHLCSQVLGDLRRRGRMPVPTASIVVDFAAHGLWVDPDVDVHFCLHEAQAQRVRSLGAPAVVACGPIVGPSFGRRHRDRAALRRRLGLSDLDRAVLIVAGSWGAGHIERAARLVGADDRFRALVVTGRNETVRRRLEGLGTAEVFGWVEDMAPVMAAADVVVENAGGLMAMEAMSVGTPVVSFEPIPGHGRENVARMDETGVSRYVRSDQELLQTLDRLCSDEPYRRRLTSTAERMFRSDLADHVADLVHRSMARTAQRLASTTATA